MVVFFVFVAPEEEDGAVGKCAAEFAVNVEEAGAFGVVPLSGETRRIDRCETGVCPTGDEIDIMDCVADEVGEADKLDAAREVISHVGDEIFVETPRSHGGIDPALRGRQDELADRREILAGLGEKFFQNRVLERGALEGERENMPANVGPGRDDEKRIVTSQVIHGLAELDLVLLLTRSGFPNGAGASERDRVGVDGLNVERKGNLLKSLQVARADTAAADEGNFMAHRFAQ